MIVRGSTGTAAHGDRQLHFAIYGATPDAVGIVLCSGQESSRAVHEDRGRVTADAKRGGAVGAAGGRRRTARICAGQQSIRGQCAVDNAGAGRDATWLKSRGLQDLPQKLQT